jgi:hypothetical protein
MKSILACAMLAAILVASAGSAEAKGCIKGAVVGGIAGHVADRCCRKRLEIRVGRSQVTGNNVGWSIQNQGSVSSYGDNYFDLFLGGSGGLPPKVQAQ